MKLLLLCACVVVASAGLAPLIVTNPRSVPNSWIVTVKDFSLVDTVGDEILSRFARKRLAAPKIKKLRHLLPVLTMKIPPSIINDIRAIDGIVHIEQDAIVSPAGAQNNPPWGIDRIDSRAGIDGVFNFNDKAQGYGVNVYMVDTGINIRHHCFGGRAHELWGGSPDQGHGTHCAGTAVGDIYGIARQAQIYSVKVCLAGVGCPISTTLDGVEEILKHGGSKGGVVSMSLSGAYYLPSFNAMAEKLWNNGYLLSHAAGNLDDDACNYSPQMHWQFILVVGSITSTDTRSGFSNWGTCVPIFAPGSGIESADYLSNTGSVTMSGTSMACPHVTGAAAVVFGKDPKATPSTVKTDLLFNSTPWAVKDTKGSHNRLLYLDPN